jgi:hypothetical protein
MSVARCERFDERLQAILDERGDPRDDHFLKEHAENCRSCGELLNLQTHVLAHWAADPQPMVPRQTEMNVAEPRRHRHVVSLPSGAPVDSGSRGKRPVLGRFPVSLPQQLAGLALLGGILWLAVGRSPHSLPLGESLRATQRSIASQDLQMSELPEMAVGDPSAVASADLLGSRWLTNWELHLDADVRRWLRSPSLAAEGPEWLRPVHGGIAPFAHSMSSTLNVLRRTLPSSRFGGASAEQGAPVDSLEQSVRSESPS